jgi:glycosyltransferase involved in cell wall biosynthesis
VINPTEAAAVASYAAPRRVTTIPHPLDLQPEVTAAERREARQRLALAEDELLLLYLGRIDIYGKGLDVLLEGYRLALLGGTARRLRLLLVGPAEPGPSVASLVAPEISSAVEVRGPVFGAEKRSLLAAADVFVTLSRWDVMPTAVLDALAMGLPLLVSEETGYGDFVRRHQAGRVVGIEPAAIAGAVAGLEVAPASQRTAIRAAAEAEFSPARLGRDFEALYESVLTPAEATGPRIDRGGP